MLSCVGWPRYSHRGMPSGYIPFEPEAANPLFQLVSSRYEQASLILTGINPFGPSGEVFGCPFRGYDRPACAEPGDGFSSATGHDLGRTGASPM
jgi:hypothetical protein